jgi:3-hydroxyisobutyrate dehydrogenase-like beta-hydroxyacid dehydrogenase
MDLGFIGLGNMGAPMCRRLIAAGHRLVVHDVRPEAVAAMVALGAQAAASPAEVADRAETIFASLPSLDVGRDVAHGERGIVRGNRVKRYVDLSTTGAGFAVEVAGVLERRGIVQIDAPVSGGVGGAEKGTLAVMVSGPADEVETVRPALSAIGKVFVIGERPGMGQTMKLANNFLSATAMAASCEAIAMGARAGLDPAVMVEAINAGSGQNTATTQKFPQSILPGTFDYGFGMALMVKDVRLFLNEAQGMSLPMEVAPGVGRLWEAAIAEHGGDTDFTRIAQTVEKKAGVEMRGKKKV